MLQRFKYFKLLTKILSKNKLKIKLRYSIIDILKLNVI